MYKIKWCEIVSKKMDFNKANELYTYLTNKYGFDNIKILYVGKKTGDNEYTIYGRKKVALDELKTIIVGASTLEVDAETAEDLKK